MTEPITEEATMNESTVREEVATLSVPTTFWNDHEYRCDDPVLDGPTGRVVKAGVKKTTVAFTEEELHNFVQDADYYADAWKSGEWRRDDDPSLYSLGRSAMSTVLYIRKNHPAIAATYNI